MGIVRYCAQCLTCGAKYRLRYNVGNKYPQSATFPCYECGEDLTLGVDESEENYITKNIKRIDDGKDLKVVNLHPELTIDPEFVNEQYYFPSIESLMKQKEHGYNGIFGFQQAQLSCIQYQKFWDEIKKDFRYLKENRWNLLKTEYGEDKLEIEKEIIDKVIFTFDFFLVGVWKKMFPDIGNQIKEVIRQKAFAAMRSYLLTIKDDVFYNKMYSVMSRYREIESILLPTLLDQKCGFVPKGISSSNDWEKIKHFYGQLYEIYGDMLQVPSAMNNQLKRGDFKIFASPDFTWGKYLDSDKAGRAANFMQNKKLESLGQYYVASIRNGTHHEATLFDKETQMITLFTGKGGRAIKQMSLIDYVVHCNELYARLLILFRLYSTLIHEEI